MFASSGMMRCSDQAKFSRSLIPGTSTGPIARPNANATSAIAGFSPPTAVATGYLVDGEAAAWPITDSGRVPHDASHELQRVLGDPRRPPKVAQRPCPE